MCIEIKRPLPSRRQGTFVAVYDLSTADANPAYLIQTRLGVVAVLVAYAHDLNDPKHADASHVFDTYAHLLVTGNKTVGCGDFVAARY